MTFNPYTIYLLFMLLVVGCSSDNTNRTDSKKPDYGTSIKINPQLPASKPLELSDVVTNFHYLKLGTREDFLIGQIYKVVFENDRIYVLDKNRAKAIFVFDKGGAPVFKISSIGRGPGEFIAPNDFDINPITGDIWIYDLEVNKFVIYSSEGKFLKEKKPKFNVFNFAFFRNGDIAIHVYKGENYRDLEDTNSLIVADGDLKVKYKAFPANPDFKTLYVVFPRALRKYRNKITFYPELSDSVYTITPANIKLKYQLDLGKKSPQRSELAGIDQYKFRKDHLLKDWIIFTGDFQETDNMIYFSGEHGFSGGTVIFYSKKSGNSISGRELHLSNFNHNFWGTPVGSNGKEFYSITYAADVTTARKFFSMTDKRLDKRLLDIFKTTQENDNPILVFYSLKDF